MANRRDRSLLHEFAALLPWWVDLGVAVGGFFACRAMRDSTRILPVPTGIGDSSALTRSFPKSRQSVVLSFATIGMWVIPIAFVAGAVLSFNQRRQKRSVHSERAVRPFTGSSRPAVSQSGQSGITPACPRYGLLMVRRTARRGTQAGTSFWGCTSYPACRGTR
jgi:hypothetical protein